MSKRSLGLQKKDIASEWVMEERMQERMKRALGFTEWLSVMGLSSLSNIVPTTKPPSSVLIFPLLQKSGTELYGSRLALRNLGGRHLY